MSRLPQMLALIVSLLATGMACAQGAPAGAGTVYKATPPPAYGTSADTAPPTPMAAGSGTEAGAAPARVTNAGGPAPVAPGAGVEIISGGAGSSDGAAKVGRMPVLQ